METIYAIIQQLGKGGNVALLFSGTLGVFTFLESMSSKAARADFAAYLTSTDVAFRSIRLHEGPLILFERVFGTRHFSLRCLARSVMVSLGALAALAGFTFLHNPAAVRDYLAHLTAPGVATFGVPVWMMVWVIWSLVPDYFNLFKTRMILRTLVGRPASSLSLLLVILAVDLIVGFYVFVLSMIVVNLSGFLIFVFSFPSGLDLYGTAITFVDGLPRFVRTSHDEWLREIWAFEFPTGDFFWAGMMPSVWLWLYLAASLVTRLAARSAPVLRSLVYFLDINEHPLRSVGFIAAVLVSGGYSIYIVVSGVVA